MVYVYATDVSHLCDPKEFPEIMEHLPEERKEKILRLARKEDRKQSLGAGLLLQTVLFRYGKNMDELRYGANGKPEIDGIYFNLSHSHDMVVCAVSERLVGCDVEKIREMKMPVAMRFFTQDEIQHIKEAKDQEAEFFRIWTIKESYMKMTGEGLKLGLENIEVEFDEGVHIFHHGQCDCYIKEYTLEGYRLSVCAKEDAFADEIEFVL